jgi:uncharacterized protein (DUF1778 family)
MRVRECLLIKKGESDFMLESTPAGTEETLVDRWHFSLNAEQWEAFIAALDAPSRELPRVKRLLSLNSIFEENTTLGIKYPHKHPSLETEYQG